MNKKTQQKRTLHLKFIFSLILNLLTIKMLEIALYQYGCKFTIKDMIVMVHVYLHVTDLLLVILP